MQVGRPVTPSLPDAAQVEVLVGMRDDVAETGRTNEPLRQLVRNDTGVTQTSKRIGVGGRRAEIETGTRRDREIDHDLSGLPEVQDDGIGGIRRGREQIW